MPIPPESKAVEIFVSGNPVPAREGETIIHALWRAGRGKDVATGCVGGVCGACTVTVRFADGRPGGTDLACLRSVEAGMQVFPFPIEPIPVTPPAASLDGEKLRAAFPTLDRCTKCDNCTQACPLGIPVMDSVLRMQRGEFQAVAEDFTTCIHCGLCRVVCEDRVKPHSMGIWVRRSWGQSNPLPELGGAAAGDAAGDAAEWEYLLAGDAAQRLQRAGAFRREGRIP